jgi:hypothetical protein
MLSIGSEVIISLAGFRKSEKIKKVQIDQGTCFDTRKTKKTLVVVDGDEKVSHEEFIEFDAQIGW